MAEAEAKTVVIDNGSNTCRAGFAGDTRPIGVFSSVVGRPRHKGVVDGKELKDSYVGDEAQSKRHILSLKYPVEYGIITNWNDMETLWHHTFYNELKVDPEEHPVLLTEAPMNPKVNREKMTQIMFENFHSPALYVAIEAVLSMYASGRTTGIVVDSGFSQSHVIPVVDGYHIPACSFKSFISGRDLTLHLMHLINMDDCTLNVRQDLAIVKDIKETLCYVAYDFKHEVKTVSCSTVNRSYMKPDGQFLIVGEERFKCPEAIFQPILADQEYPGVDDIIVNAIKRCDEEIQSDLYGNIHLCGGNTLFPGFPERLRKEIESRAPAGTDVQVNSAPDGVLSPWVGGSKMAAESSCLNKFITSELYDEYGPNIVHRMCF